MKKGLSNKALHVLHVLHGPLSILGVLCLLPFAVTSAFQTPQFRAGVDVFQVEVTVLDRDRQPLRGLQASKFSVFENGKLQPIVNFQEFEFPEYDGPLTDAVEDTAPDVVMPRYADRRLISVVLDDWSWPIDGLTKCPAEPQLIPVAKEAAKFVVNSMGTSDFASVTLTRDLRYFPDFSNNQWKLAGNVAEFKPLCDGAERMTIAWRARQAMRSVGLLPALDELIDRMAKLPQHQKAIVVVGIAPNITLAGPGDTRGRDIVTRARQAGITISGVDVLGLTVARRAGPEFFRTLAENTGGRAVVDNNELAAGITQIFREHHSYYLIGYQQTGPKDGKFRKIDVKVDVPGVVVRARSGYTAPGGTEIVKQPLFFDPDVDREIARLDTSGRLRPLFTHATVGVSSIHAAAELASSEVVAGKWAAGANVEFTVSRASGSVVGRTKARIEPGSRSIAVDIPLIDAAGSAVDLSAGPFHVSVRADSGSLSADDGVDATSGGTLLGEATVFRSASGARAPLRAAAEFRFLRSERIHIEWPVLKTIDQRQAHVLRRTGQPMAHELILSDREIDGRRAVVVDFLLSSLAEGEYVIELAAQSGQDAERKLVAFRVAQ